MPRKRKIEINDVNLGYTEKYRNITEGVRDAMGHGEVRKHHGPPWGT
jgi:hypothetical protein